MVDHSNELVVVAIPAVDDYVWKVSSEPVPHLTILYLGKPNFTPAELAQVTGYIEHASSMLESFGAEVTHRGELGDNDADVLFFSKRWMKRVVEFRGHLLQNELINRAYNSVEQYPEWTPHLTMGYPEKPAKKDDREYNRFSYVRFDKISLWTSDSAGPEFELKLDDHDLEVAMSETELGREAVENMLEHYGVKGMKWGVRRKGDRPGSGKPASSDATKAADAQNVAKRSGVKALNNDELQALVTRLNLEQQYGRLKPESKVTKGRKFVSETLTSVGKTQLNMALNQAANAQVAAALSKVKK